ncbi:hypothetical protein CYR40_03620 [Chimaeribacter arupi]|uniref:hypothetical protein n=1 Tax=Chimaeribacter arupi TaxID=2060066 RepID=UPI000C7A5D3C|nr:hypothetical protein [Chimaeribacter arupi]PLR49571.1 hypothetical protein CYR40_03620 [Chimaeribacter arupi]
MYENYTKALAVLEILEWAKRRIEGNKPFRLVSKLRKEGLYLDKSVAYLLDSLRENEALRFRNAMATIETHFARLCREDREFIRQEGPATTGFYLAYLNDHKTIIDVAQRMFLGERVFPGVPKEQVDVASVLVTGPTWVVKVLIPEVDPRYSAIMIPRALQLLESAIEMVKDKPVPEKFVKNLNSLKECDLFKVHW